MQQVLNKDIFTCPTQPLLAESPLVVCADNVAWDTEVYDDESSNAGPSEGQPLSPSAMATLFQVSSVWRYKYLHIYFFKSNLNLWSYGLEFWKKADAKKRYTPKYCVCLLYTSDAADE